jgi:CMP-N,N'-diacetyllegionaminic acid synthase
MKIGFIPAKGSSLQVSKKNLQFVGDTTLVKRTLDFASESKLLDKVIISTDDFEIVGSCFDKKISLNDFNSLRIGGTITLTDKLILHKRSPQFITPYAETIDVVKNYIFDLENNVNLDDFFIVLQPTTPFRLQKELEEILNLVNEFDSIVSVRLVNSPHPSKTFKINKSNQINLSKKGLSLLTKPRQKLELFYGPDGGYYVIKVKHLLKFNSLITKKTVTYLREEPFTLNIDSANDLKLANILSENFDI